MKVLQKTKLYYHVIIAVAILFSVQAHAVAFDKLQLEFVTVKNKKAKFNAVHFKNGMFYVFGTHRNKDIVYASKNGMNWRPVTKNLPIRNKPLNDNMKKKIEATMHELDCEYCAYYWINDITFGKKKQVIAVGGGHDNQGIIMFSPFGKNFFPVMGGGKDIEYIAKNKKLDCIPINVLYSDSVFLIRCYQSAKTIILKSKDGKIWKTVIPSIGGSASKSVIRYINKSFIIYGHISGELIVSSDGEEWKKYKTKVKGKIADIAYGNGTYVFVTGKKKIYIAKPN